MSTQLEKAVVNKQEVYYMNINTDSLRSYLAGAKNSTNPVLVKCNVKGFGIYGRGIAWDVVKESDSESPRFYGVFMGGNDYGNPKKESIDYRYRDLDYAVKDANDLADAVEASARTLFNPAVIDEGQNGKGFLNLQKWFLETERAQDLLMTTLGLKQQAQPYGTANIRIGLVDDQVRSGITLMAEKPLVFCSRR